jgi:ATP-binding cassette subfamily C protein CydC
MTPLVRAAWMIWASAPVAMWRGAALTVMVLLMGAALLGLSGWLITATGIAGLAGIGIAFDVFRPSAGVRMLALGRAAARYGERLLTHDATLLALAGLRVRLLRGFAGQSFAALERLRSPAALTRITADVDALDGVVLRLALPVVAGVVTHAVAFVALWWLVALPVAATVAAGYLGGGALVLAGLARRGFAASAAAEDAQQALRRGAVDIFRGQAGLLVQGRMTAHLDRLAAVDAAGRAAAAYLDGQDRQAGLVLTVLSSALVAAALILGSWLVTADTLAPAPAAIGVFVALALAETLGPLRRGLAELGRMQGAARRVMADIDVVPTTQAAPAASPARAAEADGHVALGAHRLGQRQGTRWLFRNVDLSVTTGETLLLTGASGAGKSTLLGLLAGLMTPTEGMVTLAGHPVLSMAEPALRGRLTLLPQRSALIAGTVRDNLRLAAPDLTDADAWAALGAAALADTLRTRAGLDTVLGEGGRGLSGGEARRLTCARAILRRPEVLLLDEPTEGLDDSTAAALLQGVRAALPDAAIVIASHRAGDAAHADRRFVLSNI